ncbi:hypothetical protein V1507DRAFT_379293, partial [Lipomyces tetrasporus]
IHQLLDCFEFSPPDDNYTVVCFLYDACRLDGRILDPICQAPNDGRSVRDASSMAFPPVSSDNMSGAGEPIYEADYGTDMVEEELLGDSQANRMETEMFIWLDDFLVQEVMQT